MEKTLAQHLGIGFGIVVAKNTGQRVFHVVGDGGEGTQCSLREDQLLSRVSRAIRPTQDRMCASCATRIGSNQADMLTTTKAGLASYVHMREKK